MALESIPRAHEFSETTGKDRSEAVFVVEPFYPGYGITLGNALRRVLLSSLPGAAITAVKIEGIEHEFSTIPGVKEDVVTIILNLKRVRLISFSDEAITLRLKASGKKEITASHIDKSDQIEIITKDQSIATLTDAHAELAMTLTVERGRGYVPVEKQAVKKLSIGTLAIDAIYTPVFHVHTQVENVRVGQMTNYERLTLTIRTDGTITPREALSEATRMLVEQFSVFLPPEVSASEANGGESGSVGEEHTVHEAPRDEALKLAIANFNIPAKVVRILESHDIRKIVDLVRRSEEELLQMKGIGPASVKKLVKLIKKFS
ncbi:MAG: DNA-directed RNA polymerase subunit alpha [Parcubacteria group bacterium]|nr:DNA-directed RNA polymerase subunit alpha [Parcubacteria group bacterium]